MSRSVQGCIEGTGIQALHSFFRGPVQGLLMLLVGPLFLRIYCELLILFFRINDNLDEVRENTRR